MNLNWKEVNKDQLKELIDKGFSTKQIADIYNISYWSIYRKIKTYNLIIPKYYYHSNKSIKIHKVCKWCGKSYYNNNYGDYCSNICLNFSKENYEDYNKFSEFGKQIVDLHNKKLTYKEISEKLNCSRSIIGYYCNSTTREKQRIFKLRQDPMKKSISSKLHIFTHRIRGSGRLPIGNKNWKNRLSRRINKFLNRGKIMNKNHITVNDIINKFGVKTTCYLTGTLIDLSLDNYCFDHIIPVSKGGSNSIDNLGITIPAANYSKNDMTVEEYLDLCKKVLEYNGYKVEKIQS